ncbi:MAG: BrnT family toxin [Kiritimatiellia bacterium]
MPNPKPSFEWDIEKNVSNQQKHGGSFSLAQFAFADPDRVILEDLGHSDDEQRFFCLGKVAEGILTVRFTHRNGTIRIFGAGYWRKGRKIYEEQNQIH